MSAVYGRRYRLSTLSLAERFAVRLFNIFARFESLITGKTRNYSSIRNNSRPGQGAPRKGTQTLLNYCPTSLCNSLRGLLVLMDNHTPLHKQTKWRA